MTFLVDANVLCEPTRPAASPKVYLHDQVAIKQVLAHLGLSPPEEPKPPPPAAHEVVRVPVDEEGREIEAP